MPHPGVKIGSGRLGNLRVCYDGLSVVWCQMRVSEQGQFGVLACCLGLFRLI